MSATFSDTGIFYDSPKESPAAQAASLLEAEQALWGKGNLTPGAQNLALEAAALLKLTKDIDIAVFGAGLAGVARDIGAATGGRVIAYEWDENLARAAARLNAQFKSGFQVKLQTVVLSGGLALGKRFDALICNDRLHALKNRIPLLCILGTAVKSGGVLLFTDYVAGELPMDEKQRERCFPGFGQMPWPLWSASDVQAALTEAGFWVETIEDLTPRYRKYTLETFTNMKAIALQVMTGKPSGTGEPVGAPLTASVRMWAARHDAMKANTLQVQRFIALKQPGDMGKFAAPWVP